jgi:predicted short-subunit dehydrogenase-like oxidoreductase (DUF2520 family)
VVTAGDEERRKLHLAAVFCNNFVNHLYVLVEEYCNKEGLDFSLLLPLIRETSDRLEELPAAKAQTGPAIRNDASTIEKHLEMLGSYPIMKELYSVLTESIKRKEREG